MPGRRKHDWNSVRNEYTLGYRTLSESTGLEEIHYPTYEELSKKFNISLGVIKERGRKEKWVRQQQTIKERHQLDTTTYALSEEYSESAQFDARILNNANKLMGVVEAFFQQYEHLHLCSDGNFRYQPQNRGYDEDDKEDPPKPIKVADLKGLVEVLEKTQTLVRRTLGEPDKKSKPMTLAESEVDGETVDSLINQRDSLKRQKDGIEFRIEELNKELKN